MANPSTTHVIEIATGIGEPAFIPLSMGQELQPISVGKKGMWRIESPRVLDVHAFVYFDGNSLFLQSADESSAASVDGFRVGKAWTELHAPCMIDIGSARLRYRSLIADADNQATEMAAGPPVQAPPGGPGSPPGASMPVAGAPPPPGQGQRMGTGQRPAVQPPAASNNPPIAFPKAERPFRPGEFSAAPDVDESTRIAPLDATGGGRIASGSHPRSDNGGRSATGANPVQAVQGGQFGAMQQGGFAQQRGYDPNQQGYPPQGYANSGGSGSFAAAGAMGQGMPLIPGPPGMPQGQLGGSYGSMTPQGVQQPPPPPKGGMQDLVAKLKANSIPKMVAGLLFIVGGILYLAEDDDPPPKKKPVAALDAGSMGSPAGGSATGPLVAPPVMPQNTVPVAPAWPAGVPCPPANWPPNTPLPCTPNSAGQTDPPVSGGRDAGGGKPPREPKDAGVSQGSSAKTLARQAVDFVAAGETAKAAAAYEELVRREPDNKVYGEAARILRAKLDAGTP